MHESLILSCTIAHALKLVALPVFVKQETPTNKTALF